MIPSRLRACLLMFAAATLIAAAGCSPKTAIAQSQVTRDKAATAAPADLARLTAGNSAFAFDLYQSLRTRDGNLFFSPYSISAALAMMYAGARGDTETQMARALHYSLGQAGLHPAFNALDLNLNSAGSGADKGSFTLKTASSLWAQQDFKFLPDFLDLLGRNYGAGVRLVDYQDSARREQARQAINDWVKTATENKIPQLLDKGTLTADTRLVLANAIYFKADWLAPFEPNSPEAPFTRLDGSTVTTRLMSRHAPTAYAAGADYQAVELPYQGGRASLVLLLPPADQFAAFEQSLSADKAAAILAGLQSTDVELYLPRFQYDTSLSLAEALAALGMPAAFQPGQADFSGATGQRDLFISHVIHKAFVAVDEKGTEAAAATAVIAETNALAIQPKAVVVRADHPFIYFIRDQQTGTILFVGRVMNPG